MVYMYETKEAKVFKKYFKKLLKDVVDAQGWDFSEDRNKFYTVDAVWFFDAQNRDSNNMWKIMLDAITETQLIWLDDRQTVERTLRIMYDTENPRVELNIKEAKWVGIFNSIGQHDEFIKANCEDCTKKLESCTIYRNALESRIKPMEIDMQSMECLKQKIKKVEEKKTK